MTISACLRLLAQRGCEWSACCCDVETVRESVRQMNSVGPTAQAAPGSLAGFDSLERMLETYLPAEQLREARRVLYGAR